MRRGVRPGSACLLLLLALTLGLNACRHTETKEPQITRVQGDKALIVSGSDTRIYHFCDCLYAKDIPAGRLKGFATPEDAEKAGKTACMYCQPRQKYQEWTERQAQEGGLSEVPK